MIISKLIKNKATNTISELVVIAEKRGYFCTNHETTTGIITAFLHVSKTKTKQQCLMPLKQNLIDQVIKYISKKKFNNFLIAIT